MFIFTQIYTLDYDVQYSVPFKQIIRIYTTALSVGKRIL